MKALLAIAAVAIMVALSWDTMLELIGKGEQEGAPPAAIRFAQAAQEQQVIPPELRSPEPTPAETRRGGNRLDLRTCQASLISNHTQPPFLAHLTRVIDGDTIQVNIQGAETRVRLWGIDAPELSQPRGPASQAHLEQMTDGQSQLLVHPVETDVYGRIVATIGEKDKWAVNMRMVMEGHAHHLDDFLSRDNPCLEEAQKFAQAQRYGIWQNGANEMTPWEYRQGK